MSSKMAEADWGPFNLSFGPFLEPPGTFTGPSSYFEINSPDQMGLF